MTFLGRSAAHLLHPNGYATNQLPKGIRSMELSDYSGHTSDDENDLYDLVNVNGVMIQDRIDDPPHFAFVPNRHTPSIIPSNDTKDFCLSADSFCRVYPFHVIFDENLEIKQCGVALLRVIKGYRKRNRVLRFSDLFNVVLPCIELSFLAILENSPTVFVVTTKPGVLDCNTEYNIDQDASDESITMRLRGQMIHLESSGTIMYLCSPRVQNLDDLKGRGLFLSDIPLHDATRDLILITQARKAERELVEKLEETSNNLRMLQGRLQEDKEMTDELLHSILPPQVAERLRLNQPVEADKYELVTVLFSDIVAFTSMCGNENLVAMDIVRLLNRLYTQFDILCTQNDVYKMETIGDAYTIVGGLPEFVETHADRVVAMALGMIEVSQYITLPDGTPIHIRVGIHSGPVLAGVVGKKMPRYCLFGSTVTIANKMEACSLPGRVNISARSKGYLMCPMDFAFEENNSRPDLPETCYFITAQPNSPRHLSPADFHLNLSLGLFRTPNPSPNGSPRSNSPIGSGESPASPGQDSFSPSISQSPAYRTPTIRIESDYDTSNILASIDAKMAHYSEMELQVRHTLNLVSPDLFMKQDRKRRRTSLGNVVCENRDRCRRERSSSVSLGSGRPEDDAGNSNANAYQLAAILGKKLRAYVEQTDTIIEATQIGVVEIPSLITENMIARKNSADAQIEEEDEARKSCDLSPNKWKESKCPPSSIRSPRLESDSVLVDDDDWSYRPRSLERIEESYGELGPNNKAPHQDRSTQNISEMRRHSLHAADDSKIEPLTSIRTANENNTEDVQLQKKLYDQMDGRNAELPEIIVDNMHTCIDLNERSRSEPSLRESLHQFNMEKATNSAVGVSEKHSPQDDTLQVKMTQEIEAFSLALQCAESIPDSLSSGGMNKDTPPTEEKK